MKTLGKIKKYNFKLVKIRKRFLGGNWFERHEYRKEIAELKSEFWLP
jgi:hypothetical protein